LFVQLKKSTKSSSSRFVLLLVLLATILLLLGGCRSKSKPEKRIKKVKEGNLELSVAVNKGDFKAGKEIPITISVKNVSQEIEFLHYHTEQRFDLEVKDSKGKAIWRWSQGSFFGLVKVQIKMEPDESEESDVIWPQKDSAGNQVPPGKYTLIAKSMADETTKTLSIDVKTVK